MFVSCLGLTSPVRMVVHFLHLAGCRLEKSLSKVYLEICAEGAAGGLQVRRRGGLQPALGTSTGCCPSPLQRDVGGLEMENGAALGIFLHLPCDTPWGGHLISTGSLASPARSCRRAPFCACPSPSAGLHLPCYVPELGPGGKQNSAKPTEAKYTPSSLQRGVANPSSIVWGS